jgi:hypothetical protein
MSGGCDLLSATPIGVGPAERPINLSVTKP